MVRHDPCRLVRQVSEIRQVRTNQRPRADPCHLVWQVNQILQPSMYSVT